MHWPNWVVCIRIGDSAKRCRIWRWRRAVWDAGAVWDLEDDEALEAARRLLKNRSEASAT